MAPSRYCQTSWQEGQPVDDPGPNWKLVAVCVEAGRFTGTWKRMSAP
jgi:hypothetical protein